MYYKKLRKKVEELNNLKKDCQDSVAADLIEEALVILDKAILRIANANQ